SKKSLVGLCERRRRTARGIESQQRALAKQLNRNRATGISQTARVGNGRRVRVDAQGAGRTGRAVERCLEMTGEIVMLELGGGQEDGIDHHGDSRKSAPLQESLTVEH